MQSACLRPSVSPHPQIRDHQMLARRSDILSYPSQMLPPPMDSGNMGLSGSIRVLKRSPERGHWEGTADLTAPSTGLSLCGCQDGPATRSAGGVPGEIVHIRNVEGRSPRRAPARTGFEPSRAHQIDTAVLTVSPQREPWGLRFPGRTHHPLTADPTAKGRWFGFRRAEGTPKGIRPSR